ncbi:uncharacterized protein LOC116302014 [Actinia tenebrosa]|uniref:Uncharacterized protein LOC116302014 n=1 Tax=Actinia tenebrosa TaxID=6105 RepID=A0A6P8IJH7_ACTTE|nr:uncharacterized protein LOC116302014 [Actinia tenebrosa]
MKFICPGLLKTGTKSLSQGLRILGYKVYDFDEQLLHFEEEFRGLYFSDKVPDFYRMFKDVDAVVDLPCCFFFEELMEAFPEAKVILTVRTDEDAWVESCKNQIKMFDDAYKNPMIRYFSTIHNTFYMIGKAGLNAIIGTTDPNATYIARKRYRWYNDRVKSVVPADKLLVYSVEEGWEPLCEFTGKDVPDQPFPHLNKKGAELQKIETETEFGRKLRREFDLLKIYLAIFVGFVAIFIYIVLTVLM